MAWQSGKPLGPDQFNISQGDIKDNFGEIDTLVNVDHEGFGAAAVQGKHKQVTLRQKVAAPTTLADEFALYTKANSYAVPAPALFLRKPPAGATPGVEVDITSATLASPGYCKLPSGLICKWGISSAITTGTSGGATLVNGTGIPNITTLLSCQLTISGGSGTEGNMFVNGFDDTGAHSITIYYWKPFAGTLSRQCYYFAIGV